MQELVLEPGRAEKNYWRDLWRYRELFYFLAWRDILVRYKQTVIGVAWAVVRPLLTTIVFTVVFGRIAGMPAPAAVPYALLVIAAMLPWQFFATALTEASNSLVGNANMISKIYFPAPDRARRRGHHRLRRFLHHARPVGLMMLWYRFAADWRILTLPLFMLLAFGAAFGCGIWLCALNVKYRDFRSLSRSLSSSVSISRRWASPAPDPSTNWRNGCLLYSLNPMVGVIDGFRWSSSAADPRIFTPSGHSCSWSSWSLLILHRHRVFPPHRDEVSPT